MKKVWKTIELEVPAGSWYKSWSIEYDDDPTEEGIWRKYIHENGYNVIYVWELVGSKEVEDVREEYKCFLEYDKNV